MKKRVMALALALILVSPCVLYAHGVVHEIKNDKAVIIRVGYDDGEPMSYAQVKIFSPADDKIEHQNGRTDKNGCFSFLPDQTGDWKITVDDGTGHGVAETIRVDEAMGVESISVRLPRWYKLIMGLSIIFGLTGLFYFFRARRLTESRPD